MYYKLTNPLKIVLLLFLILIPSLAGAELIASTEITKHISSDIDKVNQLVDYVDTTSDTGVNVTNKLNTFDDYFISSAQYYETNSSKVESGLIPVCSKAKEAVTTISSNISLIIQGVNNSDETTYNSAIDGLNLGINQLNDAAKQHDQALGTIDYGPYYIYLSVFFGLISIILFLKSRIKVIGEATRLKKGAMTALFTSSLWPAGGSAITAIWYYLTPPGSTYYILWGPVLFGLYYFLKVIWSYSTENRTIINKAVREEIKHQDNIESEMDDKQESDSHYCSECGKKLERNESFCSNCGNKIDV